MLPQAASILGVADPEVPGMLVAQLAEDQVEPGDKSLLAARAAVPDTLEWFARIIGPITWSVLPTESGGANSGGADSQHAYVRLDVALRQPAYQRSFVFDLARNPGPWAPIARGGLFAVTTTDMFEYLQAQEKTYATALDTLPIMELRPAPDLATALERLVGT